MLLDLCKALNESSKHSRLQLLWPLDGELYTEGQEKGQASWESVAPMQVRTNSSVGQSGDGAGVSAGAELESARSGEPMHVSVAPSSTKGKRKIKPILGSLSC